MRLIVCFISVRVSSGMSSSFRTSSRGRRVADFSAVLRSSSACVQSFDVNSASAALRCCRYALFSSLSSWTALAACRSSCCASHFSWASIFSSSLARTRAMFSAFRALDFQSRVAWASNSLSFILLICLSSWASCLSSSLSCFFACRSVSASRRSAAAPSFSIESATWASCPSSSDARFTWSTARSSKAWSSRSERVSSPAAASASSAFLSASCAAASASAASAPNHWPSPSSLNVEFGAVSTSVMWLPIDPSFGSSAGWRVWRSSDSPLHTPRSAHS
mmetsp:Transcript_30647/g.80410  ORF Transcript_30647/g.80410 Transcript_30647/m.80410 type:complete len:278 (-) Transcript_30647:78-911(-)